MTEVQLIIEEIKATYGGDPWHGPSLESNLEGVGAAQASQRVGEAHTIAELVLHLRGWIDVARERLQGRVVAEPPGGDYPEMNDTSEAAWKHAKDSLDQAQRALLESLSSFPDQRLDDVVPGKDYSVRAMMRGVAWHSVYHAGQIGVLRKLTP